MIRCGSKNGHSKGKYPRGGGGGGKFPLRPAQFPLRPIAQDFFVLEPASTTHYNKITTGAKFPIRKGPRAKKPGRFNKSSNREERMKSR